MGDERGSGLVGTVAGVAVFLSFLLVAVHVLVHLYATSVVGAVAFDAARIVSGADSGDARAQAAQSAQVNAAALLGRYADDTQFSWQSLGPDQIVLTVTAESPNFLPPAAGALLGLDRIERTVRVRVERFR